MQAPTEKQQAQAARDLLTPNGSRRDQVATTKGNGVARFEISGGAGTYTLRVTGVAKADHEFDEENSQLEASITP